MNKGRLYIDRLAPSPTGLLHLGHVATFSTAYLIAKQKEFRCGCRHATARQILLQRALGLPSMSYFHTRLMVDAHGVRLAKRHDALAIRTLRQRALSCEDVLAMLAGR